LADVLVILGRHRFWCEQQPEDHETLEEALTVARESRNRAAELLALQWLAITYTDLRAPTDIAIAEQERLLTLAEGAPRSYAAILGALAPLYGYSGRFDEARRTIKRSLETYKALGSSLEGAAVAWNAASIEFLAEDPVAAEEILRGGLDELAAAEERGYRATLAIYLAEAVYRRGRHGEAAAHAKAARELGLDPIAEALALAIEAKAAARLGAMGKAKDLLQEAEGRAAAARTVAPRFQGELLLARGEVQHLFGDLSAAAADYRAAHALYSEKRAWPLVERAEQLLAQLEPTPA
jgi:hypothetical protein